jgi:hypothetical protein
MGMEIGKNLRMTKTMNVELQIKVVEKIGQLK